MRTTRATELLALTLAMAAAASVSASTVVLASAGNTCRSGYSKITSAAACKAAVAGMHHDGCESCGYEGVENDGAWPSGCYYCDGVDDCSDGTWFNAHSAGSANGGARPYCTSNTGTDNTASATGGSGEEKQRVLFMGDSDVEGWNTGAAFPGSSNVGVGGYTCAQVLNNVDKYLSDHNGGKDLDWVVLVCGENDMDGTSAANTFPRMKNVLTKLLAAGVKQVLYMGTKPEPGTKNIHSKYRQYDSMLRAHATTLAADASSSATSDATSTPPLVMVDVFPSFEALGNSNNLYQNDDLHLSSNGYGHWTTWARSALNSTVCIRWVSNVCIEQLERVAATANHSTEAQNSTESACNCAMVARGRRKFNIG